MLNDFPIPECPESWPLNATFLHAVGRAMREWKQNGYSWKFGTELEFHPMGPAGIREARARAQDMRNVYTTTDHMFIRMADNIAPAGQAVGNARQALTILRQSVQASGRRTFNMDPAQRLAELERIEGALSDPDPETRDAALGNALMAWLYGRTPAEGGLKGTVEPRFGDYNYGIGWWDGPLAGEVRTNRLDSPNRLIGDYHRIMAAIVRESPRFGIFPHIFGGAPHIHFSIWHGGANLMEMKDESSVDLCARALTGIYAYMHQATPLINDLNPLNFSDRQSTNASSSRIAGLRMLDDNWEWRRDGDASFTHLAKELAMIVGGSAYGVFAMDPAARPYEILRRTAPVVRHTLGMHNSGLRSTVANSFIEPDGTLKCPYDVVRQNLNRNLAELGQVNQECFTSNILSNPGENTDLRFADSWLAMLGTIKILPDNTLDTRHLHPELQAAFDMLTVTGRRTVLVAPTPDMPDLPVELMREAGQLKDSPLLATVYGAAGHAAVAAHYKDYWARQGGRMAEILTDRLSALLEDESDFSANIARFYRNELIDHAIHAETRHCWAPEDGQAPSDPGPGFMQTIKPLFNQAVRNRIEHLRGQEQASNYRISMMEKAFDMLQHHLYNAGFYDGPRTELLMTRLQEWIADNKISPIDRSMLMVGQLASETLFFRVMMDDPDMTDDDCLAAIQSKKMGLEWSKKALTAKFQAALAAKPTFAAFFNGYFTGMNQTYDGLESQLKAIKQSRQSSGPQNP